MKKKIFAFCLLTSFFAMTAIPDELPNPTMQWEVLKPGECTYPGGPCQLQDGSGGGSQQ